MEKPATGDCQRRLAAGSFPASSPASLNLIIGLLVVAFATKAGIYPLGFWFPEAHPAAPAPISALLSGIMNKVAVYGLLRFTY